MSQVIKHTGCKGACNGIAFSVSFNFPKRMGSEEVRSLADKAHPLCMTCQKPIHVILGSSDTMNVDYAYAVTKGATTGDRRYPVKL